MVVNRERTLRQTYFLDGRDRRRVHRTARRHDRLTVADRLAYWRAAQWSRGRAGLRLPIWLRISLALIIVALGLTASALLV
jgi:hypothetical protein